MRAMILTESPYKNSIKSAVESKASDKTSRPAAKRSLIKPKPSQGPGVENQGKNGNTKRSLVKPKPTQEPAMNTQTMPERSVAKMSNSTPNTPIETTTRGKTLKAKSTLIPQNQKWKGKQVHESDEYDCIICGESKDEDWIQCCHCKNWLHEECADIKDSQYNYCANCFRQ